MKLRFVCEAAVLVLGMSMFLGGCKSTPPAQQPIAIRNSDGSISNPDGSVTYPAGSRQAQQAAGPQTGQNAVRNSDGSVTVPAAGRRDREANEAQRHAEVPAEARNATLPSGTPVVVRLTETLSASRNNVGDGFTGVLDQPISGSSGTVVFARGTKVEGSVVAAKGRGRFKGAGDLGIEVTSIGGDRVSTSEFEKSQAGKGRRSAEMIGGGTGAGALIGGLAGGGKGALIGGLVGAGAGTAGSAYTGNKDVVIPSESVITFRLTTPLAVH